MVLCKRHLNSIEFSNMGSISCIHTHSQHANLFEINHINVCFFFSRLLFFLFLCVVPSYIWFDCIVICLLFADWYVDMWLKQPYVKCSNEKQEISKPKIIIIYTHKSKCTLMNRCFLCYLFAIRLVHFLWFDTNHSAEMLNTKDIWLVLMPSARDLFILIRVIKSMWNWYGGTK